MFYIPIGLADRTLKIYKFSLLENLRILYNLHNHKRLIIWILEVKRWIEGERGNYISA